MASLYTANHRRIADTDWSDGRSIAATAHEMWMDNGYKEALEKRAIRNMHLLFGAHWYRFNKAENTWEVDPSKPRWQSRLVYNDILVSVEQRIAKFRRQGRIWSPVVGTGDLEDKVVQQTIGQVMHAYWDILEMSKKMRTLQQWALSSAVVFVHPYWDRSAGPQVRTTLDDWLFGARLIQDQRKRDDYVRRQKNRFFQLFGREAFQSGFYEGPAGDPAVDVSPIFDVSWWPHEPNSWENVRIWMRTVKKTIGEAAELLGISADEVRRLAVGGQSDYSAQLTGSGNDQWRRLYYFGSQTDLFGSRDYVFLHTIYKTPSAASPNGVQALVLDYADDTTHPPVRLQNAMNQVPLIPVVEKPVRGKAYGTCLVDQSFSAQEEINVAASQASDYRSSRISPTLVNFVGNVQQGNALSVEPGRIYNAVDAQHVPTIIKMPDVPMDYFLTVQENRRYLSNISGTTTIDVGVGEGTNTRSGRALRELREQNDLRLVPFGEVLDETVSKIGNFVLTFLQTRALTERLVQLIGDDNQRETVRFRAEDLIPENYENQGGNKNYIRTTAYSTIPKNPNELNNFVTTALTPDALGRSLLDPEKDRNEILDMLGMGEFRRSFDRKRLDRMKAQQRFDAWEAGRSASPVVEEDDDQLNVDMIVRWKKTDGYQIALSRNPQLGEEIASHLEQHKVSLARKAVEPMYDMVKAHVSEWMRTRSQMLQELSRPAPGSPPEQAEQQAEFAANVVNLVLPVPLIGMGGGERQSRGSAEKPPSKKRPKQDRSDQQGVPSDEQAVPKQKGK